MDVAAVRRVRSFNRTVAERIGVLQERFLGRNRPVGEARLIWEIGPAGADVKDLRGRLDLDSGYLSRLLRSLERQGLVAVGAGAKDRRVRKALLTAAGIEERNELDRRSDALAEGILETLSGRQRMSLLAAMAEVERLLEASLVSFAVEDPRTPEARWCLEQYFAELARRFQGGFDPAITKAAQPRDLRRPQGLLLLARLRGRAIGCGAIKFLPAGAGGTLIAEFKRIWVAPDVRGLGIGRRLLAEMEKLAAEAGAKTIRLDTNRALTEAIAMYRRSGYGEIPRFNDEPYAHHFFEKRLPEN